MELQDKDLIELKLVFAMIKLMEWLNKPNDNEGEIKELIKNLQKNLDDFANLFVKEDGEK